MANPAIPGGPTRSVPVDKIGDRASDTRSTATRAGLTRSTTAKSKKAALRDKIKKVLFTNVLQVPDEVEKRLAAQGYATRWIRYKVSEYGKDDRGNVAKWRELGYEFVTPSDAPELMFGYTPMKHDVFGEIITVGDLALAKVLTEVREAIIEIKGEETQMKSKGILNAKDRPNGVTAGRRSFVTRAQKRAEEISEEFEGNPDDLDGVE